MRDLDHRQGALCAPLIGPVMYRGSHQYDRSSADTTLLPAESWEHRTAAKAGRFACVGNEVKPMPGPKVLIVDAERLVRWSLRQKCEEWGYHVIEADRGETALRIAERE